MATIYMIGKYSRKLEGALTLMDGYVELGLQ